MCRIDGRGLGGEGAAKLFASELVWKEKEHLAPQQQFTPVGRCDAELRVKHCWMRQSRLSRMRMGRRGLGYGVW